MAEHIEGVLDVVVRETLKKIERGEKPPAPPPDFKERYHSLAIKVNRAPPGEDMGSIQVEVVLGREHWLDSIERVVNELSRTLENHDWRVLRPHTGWTWYTSDNPVIRLNYYADGKYDFGGGFGFKGSEFLLPLSSSWLLYAQVGKPHPALHQLAIEQTILVKRLIAQHAFRWIVAESPVRHAEWFRPRVEDLKQYNNEEAEWERYHSAQSGAEFEIQRVKADHP